MISLLCILLTVSGCMTAGTKFVNLNNMPQRSKAVDSYLAEFCSPSFMNSKIGPMIREVMLQMPSDALKLIMTRRRPVIFLEINSSGIARFASSAEVIMSSKDAPAFQEGMTIIKLSDALNDGSTDAIKGIIAHEIAHRVLDHIKLNLISCESERATNRLIKSWGFSQEFQAASQEFGRAKMGDPNTSCQ